MGYLNKSTKKEKRLVLKMSKKIIDFSHGGIDTKNQPIKAIKAMRPSSYRRNTPERFTQENHHKISKISRNKSYRVRPKSGTVILPFRRAKGYSRITTQGSYSSTKIGFKNSMSRTRESHIKYLAENKDK